MNKEELLKEVQGKIMTELTDKSPVNPPSWIACHLKDSDFKGCKITGVGFSDGSPLKVTRIIFDKPIVIKGDL